MLDVVPIGVLKLQMLEEFLENHGRYCEIEGSVELQEGFLFFIGELVAFFLGKVSKC